MERIYKEQEARHRAENDDYSRTTTSSSSVAPSTPPGSRKSTIGPTSVNTAPSPFIRKRSATGSMAILADMVPVMRLKDLRRIDQRLSRKAVASGDASIKQIWSSYGLFP